MRRRQGRGERTTSEGRSTMKTTIGPLTLLAAITVALVVGVTSAASAAAGPLYALKATWGNTNLPPGGEGQFTLQAHNIGDAASSEGSPPLVIRDELPEGVTVTGIHWVLEGSEICGISTVVCSGVGTDTATVELSGELLPRLTPAPGGETYLRVAPAPTGYLPQLFVEVSVDPGAAGVGTNKATISGGEAPTVSDTDQVPFSPTPAAFGLVPGELRGRHLRGRFPRWRPVPYRGRPPLRAASQVRPQRPYRNGERWYARNRLHRADQDRRGDAAAGHGRQPRGGAEMRSGQVRQIWCLLPTQPPVLRTRRSAISMCR